MLGLNENSPLNAMKILIVDDNCGMREMTRNYLQDLAAEIRECEDGEDALDCLPEIFAGLGFDGLGNEKNGRHRGDQRNSALLSPSAYFNVHPIRRRGIENSGKRSRCQRLCAERRFDEIAVISKKYISGLARIDLTKTTITHFQ